MGIQHSSPSQNRATSIRPEQPPKGSLRFYLLFQHIVGGCRDVLDISEECLYTAALIVSWCR